MLKPLKFVFGGMLLATVPIAAADTTDGIISYARDTGEVYLIRPEANASPINISTRLDMSFSSGRDTWLNISPDGKWLLLDTERFGCTGWGCLVRLPIDLSQGETVGEGDNLVHAENFSAIASGGNVVVFTSTDGPHDVDLYAITRGTSGWGKPILLTNSSTYSRNEMPAFSSNGETVLFDCVNTGDPGSGSICEANVDGSGMRVVTTPADKPAGIAADGHALHHADYSPEGNFVYEGDWDGEMIYSLAAGSKTPKVVNNQYTNDNSPCVLPNGKIVSLWLNRPGGEGYHELKVMDSNGQNAQMVLQNIDVFDIGIGCGMDCSGGETNSVLSPLLMLLIKDKKSQVESK